MKVFSAGQMRQFDASAIEAYRIPSLVLMENAALRVVEFLQARFSPLRGRRVALYCGRGNNGGDGFAIARHLLSAGCDLKVVLASEPGALKGDALVNFEALKDSLDSTRLIRLTGKAAALPAAQRAWLRDADIALDALLGTGFRGALRDPLIAQALKLLGACEGTRVAVDVPSALDADSGEAAPELVRADFTVTFAAPKRGFFVRDGLHSCGEIWCGDIGTLPRQMEQTETGCALLTAETTRGVLPQRERDAHKGDAGRALIIGGSLGMSGAPCLTARAALRSGTGLCIACLPEKVQPVFAGAVLEATSHALPCDDGGRFTEGAADSLPVLWKTVDAVALGPGLSRSEDALKFARRVVRECPAPLIIDADALYALPSVSDAVQQRKAPTILTPHPGEMGELMGISAKDVQNDRYGVVARCAEKYGAMVLLKGACSLVAAPEGGIYINSTGNSGMATGGSGDVLTGTIAGLLAQTRNALDAALLGVYLHGLAGDIAFREYGNGLVAGDIAECLPKAILETGRCEEINSRLRRVV